MSASIASSRGSSATSSRPWIVRAVGEIGPASARRTSSSTPCSNIALRALLDPPCQLVGRDVEADDQRRVPRLAAPEPVLARAQARPGLGQLERAHDAAAVVRVHGGRRGRIALGEQLVRRLGAELVVEALQPLARSRRGRRRQLEVGQCGAQVEPGAADDDGRPAGGEDLVHRRVGAAAGSRRPSLPRRGRGSRRAGRRTGWSGSAARGRPASRRRRRARPGSGARPPRRRRSCPRPSARRSRGRQPRSRARASSSSSSRTPASRRYPSTPP